MRPLRGPEAVAVNLILDGVDREALSAALVASEGIGEAEADCAVDAALKRVRWSVEGPFSEAEYEARRLSAIDDLYGGPDWM